MNNNRFESIFSVHSRDEMIAREIGIDKLMNCIAEIYKESNLDFYITIKGETIYYQLFTGSQTAVNLQSNAQHKRHLFCYYYAIKMMEETSKIINENIITVFEEKNKLDNFGKYFNIE